MHGHRNLKPIRIVGVFVEIRPSPPPYPFPTNKIWKRYHVSRLLHRLAFVFGAVERLDCATAVLNVYVIS